MVGIRYSWMILFIGIIIPIFIDDDTEARLSELSKVTAGNL